MKKPNELLLIFMRNPEAGKVKTRLAAGIGEQAALGVYLKLLDHTRNLSIPLSCAVWVVCAGGEADPEFWPVPRFETRVQRGDALGERMENAFSEGFQAGYDRIVIIGTDCFDLRSENIEEAFSALDHHDFVLGPALDGGYYLLGMRSPSVKLFRDKSWGSDQVFKETMTDLKGETVALLNPLRDIDREEDLRHYPQLTKELTL